MNSNHDVDDARTDTSLAPLLHDSMVDWGELRERYHVLQQLVDTLIGVVPNCDRYLEIWPPAFRSYNIMVPNLLNLPAPVFGVGGPTPGVIGLAMYVASRTAECPYCSAHSCSFALRRGASVETVANALSSHHGGFNRGELAVIAVARGLASVPTSLTPAMTSELVDVYGDAHAEWIVLSIAMMGFLNKFMDAIGVELEQSVVDEVATTLGTEWSAGTAGTDLDPLAPARPAPPADGLRSKLRLVPLLPAAIRYDRDVQRGMPTKPAAISQHLGTRVGHDFPVLEQLRSGRARRSIASMLCENLDPLTSTIGVDTKALAGVIYATVVGDASLLTDMRALADSAGVVGDDVAAATAFARGEVTDPPGGTAQVATVLALALSGSSSPARFDAATVDDCERVGLAPETIVEIITWLSVLQLLHRLTCYLTASA